MHRKSPILSFTFLKIQLFITILLTCLFAQFHWVYSYNLRFANFFELTLLNETLLFLLILLQYKNSIRTFQYIFISMLVYTLLFYLLIEHKTYYFHTDVIMHSLFITTVLFSPITFVVFYRYKSLKRAKPYTIFNFTGMGASAIILLDFIFFYFLK